LTGHGGPQGGMKQKANRALEAAASAGAEGAKDHDDAVEGGAFALTPPLVVRSGRSDAASHYRRDDGRRDPMRSFLRSRDPLLEAQESPRA
jgi:hypothetical protein